MTLTGPQVEKLRDAILVAYDFESFEQCIYFRLDIKLQEIVPSGAFRDVVYSFIERMDQVGRTAGVLQSLKDDRPGNLTLVAVCEELLASIKRTEELLAGVTRTLVPVDTAAGSTAAHQVAERQLFVMAASVDRSKQKISEIEAYLRRIAELLPDPDPDEGILSVLKPILGVDGDGPKSLRVAFGLPRDFQRSGQFYDLIASDEACMQPVLGVISQRMYMIMWRFGYTLIAIKDEWAARAKQTADAVSALCDQLALGPTAHPT